MEPLYDGPQKVSWIEGYNYTAKYSFSLGPENGIHSTEVSLVVESPDREVPLHTKENDPISSQRQFVPDLRTAAQLTSTFATYVHCKAWTRNYALGQGTLLLLCPVPGGMLCSVHQPITLPLKRGWNINIYTNRRGSCLHSPYSPWRRITHGDLYWICTVSVELHSLRLCYLSSSPHSFCGMHRISTTKLFSDSLQPNSGELLWVKHGYINIKWMARMAC